MGDNESLKDDEMPNPSFRFRVGIDAMWLLVGMVVTGLIGHCVQQSFVEKSVQKCLERHPPVECAKLRE